MKGLFRELTPEEEKEFREWARKNWRPGLNINLSWHPIVRDEIDRMKKEKENGDSDYTPE